MEKILNGKDTTSTTFAMKQSRNLDEAPTTANPNDGPMNQTASNSTHGDSECGPFCGN